MGIGRINLARRLKQALLVITASFTGLVLIPFLSSNGTFSSKNEFQVKSNRGSYALQNTSLSSRQNPFSFSSNSSTESDIRERCKKLNYSYQNKINDNWFITGLLNIPKFDMTFCRVPKGASTFLTRLLVCLERGIMKPPFIFRPYDGSVLPKENFNRYGLSKLYRTLKDKRNFMFSRNPYSRVYSFYVDKLFSPNPFYWKTVGVPITQKRSLKANSCGHDVEFREYIQYIIDNPVGKREYHIVPTNDVCRPCGVKYDFIGKLEHFETDLRRMLSMLNMEHYPYFNQSFKEEFSADAADDIIHAFTSFMSSASKCLPQHALLERVWRVLQLRGFILETTSLPVSETESRYISYEKLTKIVNEVAAKSNVTNLKKQKHDSMVQAFLSVPLDMMHKLHDVYKEDLILFGYEEYPNDLFQTRPEQIKHIFKM